MSYLLFIILLISKYVCLKVGVSDPVAEVATEAVAEMATEVDASSRSSSSSSASEQQHAAPSNFDVTSVFPPDPKRRRRITEKKPYTE